MLCLLRANLISPSRQHSVAVVSKAVILLEPIPIPKAVRAISRNSELAAIIRRLVGARVKRKVTSRRCLQDLNSAAGSLQVCQ